MSLKKSIILCIVVALVIGIGYLIYTIKTKPEFQAGKIIIKPPVDYLDLFNDSAKADITADYVIKPKYDSTICRYLYQNGNYVIQEYSFNADNDETLPALIEVNNKNELNPKNTFCNQVRGELFSMNYKTMFPMVNHLTISLYGGEIKTSVKNDTILSLHSDIRNLSIKCNGSETSDIFCTTDLSSLPIEVLLIKKNSRIYFFMMSVNHGKLKLPEGTLYRLIR